MIVFGGNQMAPFLYDDDKLLEPKWFKYNLMNINMIGTDISCMWPTKEMLQLYDLDSPDFDRAYADYLINNDRAFIGFMLPLTGHYYNHASFVLTDLDSPPVLSMIESVCKLIQYRYGMISKEQYQYYYDLPKKQREISIGCLQRDHMEIKDALKQGFVDKIVERKDMRNTLIDLLKLHQKNNHHAQKTQGYLG